jgi:hypothetical protein
VSGVTTQTHIAFVVYLLLTGDVAIEMGVYNEVDGHCLAVQGHTRIAPTTSSTGVRTGPDMAGAWLTIKGKAVIYNDYTLMNPEHDYITSRTDVPNVHCQIASGIHWFP